MAAVAVLLGVAALAVPVGPRILAALTPQPEAVLTAPVTIGDVEQTVLATGTLKPSRLVAVGAQASGRVIALPVAVGQEVKAGDLVAEIDSVNQRNSLRTAQAGLAHGRAQRDEKRALLEKAEATLARNRRMLAQNAVSQADFEASDADVKATRAQIAALDAEITEAEVAVAIAEANLGYTRITAPIDGTVLAVVTQQGQTVNAAQSAPTIVILGRLDTMTVRAEISEADIVKVRPGQPVWFTILGDPDHRTEAMLESIEPAPESVTSDSSVASTASSSGKSSGSASSTSEAIYYIGVFSVPNPDRRLRTYMTAQVRIVTGRAAGVPTIPAAALGRRNPDGTHTVQVVDAEGRVVPRTVTIGLTDMVTAEVREGLTAGERVVTGQLGPGAVGAAPARRPGPPGPMGF